VIFYTPNLTLQAGINNVITPDIDPTGGQLMLKNCRINDSIEVDGAI